MDALANILLISVLGGIAVAGFLGIVAWLKSRPAPDARTGREG